MRANMTNSIQVRMILVMLIAIGIVLAVAMTIIIRENLHTIERQSAEVSERLVKSLKRDLIRTIEFNVTEESADLVTRIGSLEIIDELVLRDNEQKIVFEYSKSGTLPIVGKDDWTTDHFSDGVHRMSMPVSRENRIYGTVFTVTTNPHFEDEVAVYYRELGSMAPLVLLVAVMAALILQKWVSSPILVLRDALLRITAGEDGNLPAVRRNIFEIQEMHAGIDQMLARIQSTQTELQSEKERLQSMFHSISDGIICLDADGCIEYLNPGAEDLLGCTVEKVKHRPVTEVMSFVREHARQTCIDPAARALKEARHIETEHDLLMVTQDRIDMPVSVSASPVWNSRGSVSGVVMVIHDSTESREMQRVLSYQASHDGLTGLANRRELESRLSGMLAMGQQGPLDHVLCFLDLDQFKVVNDTCGHVAGDELLKQVAFILQQQVREADIVVRLGGDEFAILLECCPIDNARKLAEGICQSIRDFRFVWEDKSFDLGISIGLVEITGEETSVSKLLSAADLACYAAKDSGRNRVWVYAPDGDADSARLGEMQWVSRITQALADNRFVLYRQMVRPVSETGNAGSRYEVLVRMLGEDGKIIPPGAFLPAAERYNLAPALDRWVIRNTFMQLVNIPGELDRLESCAINVSACSLTDDDFLRFVIDHFRSTDVPPGKICFEITETSAIANLGSAKRFIDELRQLGCHFALDDFGAGMSSFAYLKNLDVDYIKIDGMFVKDILSDPIDMAMVTSINDIGHVMGMQTIAEFVESDDILARLREIGVDFAQGYGVAVPEPFDVPAADPAENLQAG
jgi:diguanylate cyclase (GGDEF)-like protein/PAS domain S-box-containing protein